MLAVAARSHVHGDPLTPGEDLHGRDHLGMAGGITPESAPILKERKRPRRGRGQISSLNFQISGLRKEPLAFRLPKQSGRGHFVPPL
jgi:hypothetical protein